MDALVLRARAAALALSPAGRSYWQNFTNAVVVYLLLKRTLKATRHLRARGILQTASDFYRWVVQVRPPFVQTSGSALAPPRSTRESKPSVLTRRIMTPTL